MKCFFLCLLFWSGVQGNCKEGNLPARDSALLQKPKLNVFPGIFYSPDTRWGFGGAGILTFSFNKDSIGARRSSFTFGFAFTQLKQTLVFVPFQLFPQNQKYWIYGELGYYKYVFNFFGTGNNYPDDFHEKFDAHFPRIRLNALRKVTRGLYLGGRFVYDDFEIIYREGNPVFNSGVVPGSAGGRVSGFGTLLNFDSRDHQFLPSRGIVLEGMVYAENEYTGSHFNYQRYSLDVSTYFPIYKDQVLALNMAWISTPGNTPFHQMPGLGGTRRLRGYFEGKYRDKNLALVQAEYRLPVIWRIGMVAFTGSGVVAETVSKLSLGNVHFNYGAGLRLLTDPKEKINLRFDAGFGKNSKGFYLTIGEAF